jgi:mRNA interferase RelE/StbE
MAYRLEYAESIEKDLKALPQDVQQRVLARIEALPDNPRPPGVECLKGNLKGLWRVRVGGYRVGYRIEGDTIFILKVDKRGSVYKKLKQGR